MLRNITNKPVSLLFNYNRGRTAFKISFSNKSHSIQDNITSNLKLVLQEHTNCPNCTQCSLRNKQIYYLEDQSSILGLIDHPYLLDDEVEDVINEVLDCERHTTCIVNLISKNIAFKKN